MTWLTAWVRWTRALISRDRQERDLDAELQSHLQMHIDENIEAGMSPSEARRVARARLGGVEQVKERWREMLPLSRLGTYWLDVKLGARRLRTSWGLTLVGGLSMVVAIGIPAGTFGFFQSTLWNSLPFDGGEQVVGLWTWDPGVQRRSRPALQDFARWRDGPLKTVMNVGAFRSEETTLDTDSGPLEQSVTVAEMSASGFRLARVPPLLGRTLLEEDERPGAPPVVVLGSAIWHASLAADPNVVGRSVWLGGKNHVVVGVMPDGFAFPVDHQLWVPLRTELEQSTVANTVSVFGRLNTGETVQSAQAELEALGLPAGSAIDTPATALVPRVVPYTLGIVSSGDPMEDLIAGAGLLLLTLLILPPCANMAIVVYAKTVARQQEFAARYALGADRGRIVGQVFLELLVLCAGAAGVALVTLRFVGGYLHEFLHSQQFPFWIDYRDVPLTTVVFAGMLACLAAFIAGGIPALRATRQITRSGLGLLSGGANLQLGRLWTTLVVAQVALSVATLPLAAEFAWSMLRPGILGPGFAADEFVTARVSMVDARGGRADGELPPSPPDAAFTELVWALESQPSVSAVTIAAAVPGHEPYALLETERWATGDVAAVERHAVQFNTVDHSFFDVFDVSLAAGRGFEAGDNESVVLIDRTFAAQLASGGSPLGRRVKYVRYLTTHDEPSPAAETWYTIVGVVNSLPANTDVSRVYHIMRRPHADPAIVTLRTSAFLRGRSSEFLSGITAALGPTIRVTDVRSLGAIYRERQVANNLGVSGVAAATMSVLLLATAGMYALLSFSVTQRRKEIGVRSALGALPVRLIAGVLRRAIGQVAMGLALGLVLAVFLDRAVTLGAPGAELPPAVEPSAALVMTVLGVIAAVGPACRVLRVELFDALRES